MLGIRLSRGNFSNFGVLSLTGYNASVEAFLDWLLLSQIILEIFYYSDNRFDANFNYSIFLPRLFNALLRQAYRNLDGKVEMALAGETTKLSFSQVLLSKLSQVVVFLALYPYKTTTLAPRGCKQLR